MTVDRNSMAYWWPPIATSGLRVPATRMTRSGDLTDLLDGKTPPGFDGLIEELTAFGDEIGWPVFLRTGHGSGKHQWAETCYVPAAADLSSHVFRLVEWSHLVDFFGLPTDCWVVREMISTSPLFHCEAWDGFPVTREFRYFIEGGQITHRQAYWPSPRVGVARVIETPALQDHLAALGHDFIGNPGGSASVRAPRADRPAVPLDVLRHLDEQLRLASLDTEVGEQLSRYLGCVVVLRSPVVEGSAVLRSGGLHRGGLVEVADVRASDEGCGQEVTRFTMDLLELDHRLEAGSGSGGASAQVDAEGSVGVKHPSEIGEDQRIWLHEVKPRQSQERVVLAVWEGDSPFQDARPDHPEWREILEVASVLEESEDAVLSGMARLAWSALTAEGQAGPPEEGWSIDFLEDSQHRWWVTDMAVAADSFRYDP